MTNRKLRFAAFLTAIFVLAGCDPSGYADMSPSEKLVFLNGELEARRSERAQGVSGFDPINGGMLIVASDISIRSILNAKSEILTEHPDLADFDESLVNGTASGGNGYGPGAGSIQLGQTVASVSASGNCGMPASAVGERIRRAWHSEAAKGTSNGPFQTNSSARSEIMSLSTPPGYGSTCAAINAQIAATFPTLNASIRTSNTLHNGNGLGFNCNPTGGAAADAACSSVQIFNTIQTMSYMCHEVCSAGR